MPNEGAIALLGWAAWGVPERGTIGEATGVCDEVPQRDHTLRLLLLVLLPRGELEVGQVLAERVVECREPLLDKAHEGADRHGLGHGVEATDCVEAPGLPRGEVRHAVRARPNELPVLEHGVGQARHLAALGNLMEAPLQGFEWLLGQANIRERGPGQARQSIIPLGRHPRRQRLPRTRWEHHWGQRALVRCLAFQWGCLRMARLRW
mmetsp:Transcript_21834/g.47751  ORF Transcript_21834/g.47751 Transcript_21834/m.47751 type:complete len:207 (-) Transcript_21834:44-664(-)